MESKLDLKNIKKQISEIVHNNGDIIKENYNRYLSPFMISPVIIWSEYDESFDEIYDTLVGNGQTPTYARLANYDLKPLSNEYQRLLDTEIICLCATIDNHMLKVGIMFDDDKYNCLLACGFTPNGDGTWDISGENYSQEKAEKYYLDEYIKPLIEIARKRLNEIHTVFDGKIYNNEKSYWGDILFGDNSEPADDGSELDESKQLNENVSNRIEVSRIDDLMEKLYAYQPRNTFDSCVFECNNYLIVVDKLTDPDLDPENDYEFFKARLYDAEIAEEGDDTDAYITEIDYSNYETLCHAVVLYIKNNPLTDVIPDDDTEPEKDGSELDEAENSRDDWKPHELEPGDDMFYNYKGYDLNIQRLTDKDNTYDLRIFKEGDGHILEWERFHSLEEITRFIKNFFDGQEEPEWDGDTEELDERFDMKTIRKQIDEIVEKANG